MGMDGSWRGYPLPSDLWNHRVRGKSPKDLWGSISYRQNLGFKELKHRFSALGFRLSVQPKPSRAGVRLLHHYWRWLWSARSDVTSGCGKVWKYNGPKDFQGNKLVAIPLRSSVSLYLQDE